MGVILNRVKGNIDYIIEKLEDFNLPLLTKIPEDNNRTEFEIKYKPIIYLPEKSKSFLAINKIIDFIFYLH